MGKPASTVAARVRLRVRRALHRARIAARYALRSSRSTPFFVLFAHRSGSNLLASYLECLPGVRCLPEVLQPGEPWGLPRTRLPRRTVIRHLRHSMHRPGVAHVGVRIALRHLERQAIAVADLAGAFPGARFIVLYRACIPDQYVSWLLAIETGRWKRVDGVEPPGPQRLTRVRIDRELFAGYARALRAGYRAVLDAPAVRERGSVVCYEELVREPQRVVDRRLAPLLGVEPRPVRTALLKLNTLPPEAVVSNFEQVRDLWADPEFRQCYPHLPGSSGREPVAAAGAPSRLAPRAGPRLE